MMAVQRVSCYTNTTKVAQQFSSKLKQGQEEDPSTLSAIIAYVSSRILQNPTPAAHPGGTDQHLDGRVHRRPPRSSAALQPKSPTITEDNIDPK
jgi:hypothetical protein